MERKIEKYLIWSLLSNPSCLNQVTEIVSEKDFIDHLYRHAFLTICNMAAKNEVVELASLYLEMGRPENISDIIDNSDSEIFGPVHYARLLKKRNLENEISRLAKEREFQQAKEAIKEIENLGKPATLLSISNMIEANPEKSNGITTGYQDLDKMVKMKQSDLIILAGKTSIGKTTLGLTMLGNIAKRESTGLISFEMSPQGIVKRLSEIYSMDYLSQINSSFFVSCPNAFTLSETRKSIQNMKQKYDTRIFMIDYLQLMQEVRQYRSRHLEISYIIRKLKEMGTEMKIIMIVVAQLSRNIDARGENAVPCLGDLKESGDIEYASDIVLFLHRERNSNNADLIVAKQRYGEKCIVKLVWLKDRLTYGSYDWKEERYE